MTSIDLLYRHAQLLDALEEVLWSDQLQSKSKRESTLLSRLRNDVADAAQVARRTITDAFGYLRAHMSRHQ